MTATSWLLVFILVCNVVIVAGVVTGVILVVRGLGRFEREMESTVKAAVDDFRSTARGFTDVSVAGRRVLEEIVVGLVAKRMGQARGSGKMGTIPAALDLGMRALVLWRQLRPRGQQATGS